MREQCALVVGPTGSGKTNMVHSILAGFARADDILTWVIDLNAGAGPRAGHRPARGTAQPDPGDHRHHVRPAPRPGRRVRQGRSAYARRWDADRTAWMRDQASSDDANATSTAGAGLRLSALNSPEQAQVSPEDEILRRFREQIDAQFGTAPEPQTPAGNDGPPATGGLNLALCERAGEELPPTYQVRTPSGGRHLYFTAPPSGTLPSSVNRLGPHIDTRAWGGYVVAPGSTTPDGAYEVLKDAPVAALPHWLTPLLVEPSQPAAAAPAPLLIHEPVTRRARAALEREVAAVAATTEGGRNNRLLEGARALGRFVAWGEIPRNVVEEAFQAEGETAGLSASECRATIRSALDWSIRTCRPRDDAA